jgi:hypothetical protein
MTLDAEAHGEDKMEALLSNGSRAWWLYDPAGTPLQSTSLVWTHDEFGPGKLARASTPS